MSEAPLWTPSEDRVARAAMTAARLDAQEVAGRPLPDYDAFHAWSVQDADAFWSFLAARLLPWRARWRTVRAGGSLLDTRWFEDGRLNVAEALLYPPGRTGDAPAVVAVAEDAPTVRLSLAELRALTARVQAALRASGVGPGDTVALVAANVPEALAVFLACAAEGAVFTSCSPDFGADAAAARFTQVAPKVLFGSPAARYGGRRHDVRPTLVALEGALPSLRARVALPVPGEGDAAPPRGFASFASWTDVTAGDAPDCRPLPFDHPLYVLYSSGTTGPPKAIRHRAGGALLSQLKELRLHADVRPGDRVTYYTTTGWMMWNWLVAALGLGAVVTLIDGSPMWPDRMRLWRLARDEDLSLLGTSARYLHALDAAGARPRELGPFPALRTVASTGSPLSRAGFRFVYREVTDDVHLASISGGTDIVSCFLLGVPTLPVYAGQIQRPGLGVDLAVYGEQGRALERGPGELVCRQPLPSMPLGFVHDEDGRRYHEAYGARFPGVWTHGDRIERRPEGGYVHHGRSDATLNPGGVRIGSAEVTGPVLALPGVVDAAAVPRPRGHDEEIWLLVVMAEDIRLDEAQEGAIRQAVREGASPRHVPARVLAVPDLPRTRNGKTMEKLLAALVAGRDPGPLTAVGNPEAIDAVRACLP
ncbi:MAG: acetoacetate--CoA ligase [Trueperaceae bacterium]|nr:acetoacetate--CoA ligase [Trueperaceae bacterium]